MHFLWLHACVVAFLVFLAVRPRNGFLLLGLSFAASWVGDLLARFVFGGGFEAFYLWVPVQIALAFLAVERDYRRRWIGAVALLVLVPLSVALSYPAPEVLVMAVGSAAVCLLVRGELRWPVYLYFGVSSFFHLVMVAGAWEYLGAYHTSRFGAFAVFVALAVRSTDVGVSSRAGRRLRHRGDAASL